MEAIETYEVDGLTIEIHQDDHYESPREWDNVTEIVCWHRRYDLGDRQPDSDELRALERGGLPLVERYLRLTRGVIALRPLGLIDHSGISMWVGGGAHWCDPGGWDSGTVGFAYVTRETAAKESPYCDGPADLLAWAHRAIEGEVETYDQYLRGDVYGFVITDPDGEILDGCWGFYGFDYAVEEAKSAAGYVAEERRRDAETEAQQREHWANHDLSTEVTQ